MSIMAAAPEVGTEVDYDNQDRSEQRYECVAVRTAESRPGGSRRVAVWRTNCRTCGGAFYVSTPATPRALRHRLGGTVRDPLRGTRSPRHARGQIPRRDAGTSVWRGAHANWASQTGLIVGGAWLKNERPFRRNAGPENATMFAGRSGCGAW